MYNIYESIRARVRAAKWFLGGRISLSQSLCLSAPAFLKPNIKGKSTVVKFLGNPFTIPNWEVSDFMDMREQIISANQYHIELIKDGDIVVDAGANMGVFSIFVATTYPHCTIYAFEPAPNTFMALSQNTKYYPNIKVFNCGLGEEEKKASILVSDHTGANYVGEGGVPIDIKTIDGLNLRVDFLKMDTEGYEANILQGAKTTIKKWKPVIAMSAYHKPNDAKELPALLNSITSYNCELKHDSEADLICKPA